MGLLSPVLLRAICGRFREASSRQIQLDEVGRDEFERLIDLAVGRARLPADADLWTVMRLAALADRFQMDEVRCALEDATIRRLSVGSCTSVLTATAAGRPCLSALARVRAAAQALTAESLDAVAATEDFRRLGA